MSDGLSRRQFVSLLLGAPALSAGCARRARPPLPPGALVDTGMGRGHARLRDVSPPLAGVGAAPLERTQVVVVGGGAAGLAAAWRLRRRGVSEVVVLEHCEVPGGTARGERQPPLPHPWGAHYIVAPIGGQGALVELLDEMGAFEGRTPDGMRVVDEALRCREPEERLFYRGRWYEGLYLHAGASLDERRQFTAFVERIERLAEERDPSGRRPFAIPLTESSPDEALRALDRRSFAEWLDAEGFRAPRLRWLTDYACRDDYGLLAKDTSAWAGLFYFAARQKMGEHRAQPVVTWPEGNARLTAHLGARVDVRTATTVVAVRPDETGVFVEALAPSGAVRLRAERVVVAVPQFVARRIVPGLAARAEGDHPDYGAWAVANLHLSGRPRRRAGDAPPAWDNVLYDSKSLGYVASTHQAGRDTGPTVWTWYYPFCELDGRAVRESIAAAGQAEWAEVVLTDLERAHPDLREHVQRLDVAFWGHGMVRPRVGSLFGEGRLRRAEPLGRVHFAHTDLSGMALFEEAFSHGCRAAEEIAPLLGRSGAGAPEGGGRLP
jgi:phytoene dehydrogenase-like protein